MTQNRANKHQTRQNSQNSAWNRQAARSYASEEDMLILLNLSQVQIENPLEILNSRNAQWQDRARAIQSLIKLADDPTIAKRIENCAQDNNESERVRTVAIRALGELRKANQVPKAALLRLINIPELGLRATLIETLASLGPDEWNEGERFLARLRKALLDTRTPSIVRAALVRLLATLKDTVVTTEIVTLLDEAEIDRTIRAAIVDSLAASETVAFEKLLYDPEQEIRVSAAYRLGRTRALERLIRILKTSNESVIVDRGAQLLGELGEGTAEEIDVLLDVAENTHNQALVRMSAILAVGQLYERQADIPESAALLKISHGDSDVSVRIAADTVMSILHPERFEDDADGEVS